MTEREEIISKITTVKAIPASGVQAINLLLNPDANMGEIVQVIKYDPGLTASILKLANSSMFGATGKIASLRDAVVRLGTSNIFTIVTSAVANLALNREVRGYGLSSGELWNHSMAVAVASESTCDILRMDTVSSKKAFTAGLLHDIGKILLGTFIKKNAKKKLEGLLAEDLTFIEAEKETLGIDHAELGAILLNAWNLPKDMVEIVEWHHEPEKCEEDNPVSEIIHIADYICVFNHIGTRKKMPLNTDFSKPTFKRLNFNNDLRKEIVEQTKNNLETINDIFSKHV